MEPLSRYPHPAVGRICNPSENGTDYKSVLRRDFLRLAGLCGAAWMTPISHLLARAAEAPAERHKPAQSIIMLWLQGGPSQLETFDPHPDTKIAAGTGAIRTAVKDVQLAAGLDHTADEMGSIALIRSMVSKEGDHERGTYTMKTGFRPDPTVIHPSIGAICCHELPVAGVDIPRHVSILPGQWPARGGYLGESSTPSRPATRPATFPTPSRPIRRSATRNACNTLRLSNAPSRAAGAVVWRAPCTARRSHAPAR